MLCSAYFGKLSEERKKNWNNGDENPYAVLELPIELEGRGHDLWGYDGIFFSEKIQIDWGSFAWKCTQEEILRFLKETESGLSWQKETEEKMIRNVKEYMKMHGDTEYGVVFIEES